jgi:hemoglobin/transferrin/lactoferrin receptor protein
MSSDKAIRRFALSQLSLCVGLACSSMTVWAQTSDTVVVQAPVASTLKETVVTATRSEADASSLSSTVTSIDRTKLDRSMPMDEADLFEDEPDIAFARDLRRHGATRVNIRGIEDNRVVSLVDGVRLGDYYNGGGPTNFTQSSSPSVMPDFLKRVEIVRGAASSLYGSDAIGGVVGYVTLNPSDLLQNGASTGVRLRAGYNGANQGLSQTVIGAFRGETTEVLLGYSHASGKETKNMGKDSSVSASRTAPNPLETEDNGVLGKFIFKPVTGHKFGVTIEGRNQQVDSNIYRMASSLPKVTSVRGDDNAQRVRASVEWEHTPRDFAAYDKLTTRLYRQESETRNYNFQNRTNTSATCSAASGTGNNCYIESDFSMDQTSMGTNVLAEKGWGMSNLLTYGADLSRTRVEELRDTRVWNLTAGTFSKSLAGETYPLRDFAIGKTDTLGLFVQNEFASLAGGQLSVTPGVRYDYTRLTPEVDALAQQTLTAINRQAVEKSFGSFSPKLGAVWRFDSAVSAYGQVARGFRAPNYAEVNGVFRNTAQQYGITPNPDLKPETSVGVEVGVRTNNGKLRTQLSAFNNQYKDFIESVRFTCPGNPSCISGTSSTYQSVNLSSVRIYGAEARAGWDFAPGWSASGALAVARGTNEETGQPLNSVEPTRLTTNLTRDFGEWGTGWRVRAAQRKDRTDDVTSGVWFKPGGYVVNDLTAWWKFTSKTSVTFAVNNVFDKKYWLWSDIRQADAVNPAGVDFYSQPGRHITVALQADF